MSQNAPNESNKPPSNPELKFQKIQHAKEVQKCSMYMYRPKMVYIDKRTIKVKDEILLSIYENYKEVSPIEIIPRE